MRPGGLIRLFIATFKEQCEDHYDALGADATVSALSFGVGSL